MEEILASIRRIISEDEDSDSPAPAEAAKPAPAHSPAPAAIPTSAGAFVTPDSKKEDVEMIKQNVAEAIHEEAGEAMLDENAATAASNAFANLSDKVKVSDGPGRSLEDIVTEMLKPMIKEWLDANLPAIVEEKVEEEVQRVARRRR